jgi:hypothetical protein
MIQIGGDMDHGRPRSMPTPSTTDPSQFTKALQQAAAHIHIVPATIEAGQLALAKKKEKDSIYRVNEVGELVEEDEPVDSVDKVVQEIAQRIRLIAEIERKSIGL